MEGLRGLAALLVFFVHFNALFRPYIRPNSWQALAFGVAGTFGHTGVDLFFVLSGFLIYGIILEKHPKWSTFVYRRARRLYPVFLAVFALYLALSFLVPAESKLPHSAPAAIAYIGANLLMLPGMVPNIVPMITQAWSLSYEWFFYLSLPMLVAVVGMRRWSRAGRVTFFLLLPAVYCLPFLHRADARLMLFAAGILLWETVDAGVPQYLTSSGEYVVAAAFVINILIIGLVGARLGNTGVVLTQVPHFYAPSLFVTLLFFCLYAMFFKGFLARIFSWDYIRWMGNISYSYYLIHGLALHAVKVVLNRALPPSPRSALFDFMLLAVCLAFSIVCAALLFLWVEKPLSWSVPAKKPLPEVRPVAEPLQPERVTGTVA